MPMSRWLSVRLFFFGTRMYAWKRYGLAGSVFQLVAERGSENWSPSALNWLGNSLAKTGHIGRAQEAYRRCVDLGVHQNSADAAISLAQLRKDLQGDADGAIDAYYTALRLGENLALEPLITLLDARGDKDEADALRAKASIRSQLSAALDEAGHHYADDRAKTFHGHVIAALEPRETVKRVAWTPIDHEDWDWRPDGYLVLTDQRLMLLDDFHYPNKYYGRNLPDYVLLSIDRDDIDDVQASKNADGTWISVDAGSRFRARVHGNPGSWVKPLKPRNDKRR
jgi:tetratricopeptide (TPR) repeat protein